MFPFYFYTDEIWFDIPPSTVPKTCWSFGATFGESGQWFFDFWIGSSFSLFSNVRRWFPLVFVFQTVTIAFGIVFVATGIRAFVVIPALSCLTVLGLAIGLHLDAAASGVVRREFLVGFWLIFPSFSLLLAACTRHHAGKSISRM
jgi:hypothetical protein